MTLEGAAILAYYSRFIPGNDSDPDLDGIAALGMKAAAGDAKACLEAVIDAYFMGYARGHGQSLAENRRPVQPE